MFHLSIIAQTGDSFVPRLRRQIRRARSLIKTPLSELSLALVGDARMRRLHREFMDIDSVTDVLTFPLEIDPRGRVTGGEVVVCVPEARRQAKKRAISPEDEVLLYALHGMLHLCGFDDRTERDYRRMHRMEDKILQRLGVGPVFHPPRKPAPAMKRTRGST
jgi:probable rRNA maturation factor